MSKKSILDRITPEDEVILGLYRNHQVSGYEAHLPGVKPSDPIVAKVRKEVEDHAPGYAVLANYRLLRDGSGTLTKGTALAVRPTEETVQDHFYDAFTGYFSDKYGEDVLG